MELRLELKRGNRVQLPTEEVEFITLPFPFLRKLRKNFGRSCAVTAKKFTKKRDERAELLFCSLNLLLFSDVVVVFVGS